MSEEELEGERASNQAKEHRRDRTIRCARDGGGKYCKGVQTEHEVAGSGERW